MPSLSSQNATLGTRYRAAMGVACGPDPDAADATLVETTARDLLRAGQSAHAAGLLRRWTLRRPGEFSAWRLLGFALREDRDMPEALQAFERALEIEPGNAGLLGALAQTRLDAGLPAVDAFRAATLAAPEDLAVVRGLAQALVAQSDAPAAVAELEARLARQPQWMEGHKCLATIRWTEGDTGDFARSFAAACHSDPRSTQAWLAWFSSLALARRWDRALEVIGRAERACGEGVPFAMARLFVASESQDVARAEELFEATAHLRDDTRDLALIRHCIRQGRLEQAESVALGMLGSPSARAVWAYLSTIWRLRGDERAHWLDGDPPFVRYFDLGIPRAELDELAALLRTLHVARTPYLEQSVRGGTQTDGQLFYRTEPLLRRVRRRMQDAVRTYIDMLGPVDDAHPLLGPARDRIRFSGSWSVRLAPGGRNVAHVHPKGWISAAFYVAVPGADEIGPPPSGWIEFGRPPEELGLTLAPFQQVEPRPGRMALFPSTMWHSTVPFAQGERMVIAADVAIPPASLFPAGMGGA